MPHKESYLEFGRVSYDRYNLLMLVCCAGKDIYVLVRFFKNIIEGVRSFLLPPSKLQQFPESSGSLFCPNLKLSVPLVISIQIHFWVPARRRIKFPSDGFKDSRWIECFLLTPSGVDILVVYPGTGPVDEPAPSEHEFSGQH
ncbi:hypothetical protein OROMI_017146 [Orobanche minor]